MKIMWGACLELFACRQLAKLYHVRFNPDDIISHVGAYRGLDRPAANRTERNDGDRREYTNDDDDDEQLYDGKSITLMHNFYHSSTNSIAGYLKYNHKYYE